MKPRVEKKTGLERGPKKRLETGKKQEYFKREVEKTRQRMEKFRHPFKQ